MIKPVDRSPETSPSIRATPFLDPVGVPPPRLTDRQREQLIRIGIRVRLPARMTVYREQTTAQWVFAVVDGVVKSYRELPSGKRTVSAFLFARDLFGLAENGRYLNTAQTVTSTVLYRLPLNQLAALLKHDGELQFQFLTKVTHELRESQRRSVLINRRDAAGRLAMFVAAMRDRQNVGAKGPVSLPMTRSDIAGFLGLSLESVSRAAAALERRGLVSFEGRNLVHIADVPAFAKLVAAV
jgi:CRP/FNR family transcriptional regulator, anaerobic regulatory protein